MLGWLVASSQNGVKVRTLGGDRAGEVRLGRFLRNKRVKPAEMVQTARSHTATRVQGRHVLVIQDTADIRDERSTAGRSLQLHAAIVVDAADGSLLGLCDATFHLRTGAKRNASQRRSIKEKQSCRWLDANVAAATLAGDGAACMTGVMDRDGDVYEVFALRPPRMELVVRVQ